LVHANDLYVYYSRCSVGLFGRMVMLIGWKLKTQRLARLTGTTPRHKKPVSRSRGHQLLMQQLLRALGARASLRANAPRSAAWEDSSTRTRTSTRDFHSINRPVGISSRQLLVNMTSSGRFVSFFVGSVCVGSNLLCFRTLSKNPSWSWSGPRP
jgi:hypothetical protein